jgi:quinol monooxygenase YgiN
MIVVIGRAEVDPAAVARLRPLLVTMMAATRAEPGCISYSLSVEDEAAGIMSIAERWADDAALAAHFAKPHMAAFNAASDGLIRAITATKYDVTGETDLAIG